MVSPYDLQLGLDYIDDVRECLDKLEELDLQDVISNALDECQKWADEIKVRLETAEPIVVNADPR